MLARRPLLLALSLSVVLTGGLTSALAVPSGAGTSRDLVTSGDAPAVARDRGRELLEEPMHGRRAVRQLGDRLAAAAQRNDMSVHRLEDLLRSDPAAWVDAHGQIFYIDDAPSRTLSPAPAEQAPHPYEDTFSLHSNPVASRVIYLDFDGHSATGSYWMEDYPAISSAQQPAFTLDADGTTFTEAERDIVQSVWQRVSEDFAPFSVDVTTEDPGSDALRRSADGDDLYGMRVVITPSNEVQEAVCPSGCGGIAYLNVFDYVHLSGNASLQPAWVFSDMLSNAPKYIADAASHEVGHTLALLHDGTRELGYYRGQGSWGPIMGSPFDMPITQWSSGEYADADNQEDDTTIINNSGAPLRNDDHGDGIAAATSLGAGTTVTGSGVIATRGDVDYFSIVRGCTGTISVQANAAPVSPDLDVRLRLLSANGAELASADPSSSMSTYDLATGMSAAVSTSQPAGTYYLEIDGVGALDPFTTGYSDYASLGTYTVTANGCGETPPSVPLSVSTTKDDSARTATISWAQPASTGGSPITGYRVTRSDEAVGGAQPVVVPAETRSHTFTSLAGGTAYTLSVQAVNAAGDSPAASGSVTMAPGVPSAPTNVAATQDDQAQTAALTWAPPASDGGSQITGYLVTRTGTDIDGQGPLSENLSSAAGSYTFDDLAAATAYSLSVKAINAQGVSAPETRTVTIATRAPSAPTAVSATAGRGSATLSWSIPADAGTSAVSAYRIRRFSGTSSTVQETTTVAATPQTYTATGLTNGATYRFDVTAVSDAGTGSASTKSNPVTPVTVPDAPRIGKAKSGPLGGAVTATATWFHPYLNGGSAITGFHVTALKMRANGTVASRVVSAWTVPGRTSLSMRLTSGKYRFTVQAKNAIGTSKQSLRSNLVAAR